MKKRKINYWWSSELKDIYESLEMSYHEYKNSNFDQNKKLIYLNYKKQFRIQKRYNITLKRDKHLKLIDEMFKLNKIKFWRKVKNLSKTE